jgi:hypothetical protein
LQGYFCNDYGDGKTHASEKTNADDLFLMDPIWQAKFGESKA